MGYGRTKIYSDVEEITAANVVDEVSKAYAMHIKNQADIKKLWDYYRGKTAILNKKKEIREDINHQICENRAFEVVKFHKGYSFGEPILYVRRENTKSIVSDDVIAADINALNGHMAVAKKASCDSALGEWMFVSGVGYRLTLPNKHWTADGDESPFTVMSLDPQKVFVVYSSAIDEHPLMAVCVVERQNGDKVFSVYTESLYFEFVEASNLFSVAPNALGMIPIVEYPTENARLGVFEVCVDLLDALSLVQSNRMDDIVQYVNSFLAVIGAQLDEDTYKKLNEWKTLCLPEGTDAKYLSSPMSQTDVQRLKDDLVQSIFEICSVPNRSGSSGGTSDNGVAVLLRDGYTAAEAYAKSIEQSFESAEAETLKIVLRILRDTTGTSLRIADIKPHFTRRNYENIATKSQVLIAMLNNSHIHPETAFTSCGMFPDPESAYLQGKAWHEEQQAKAQEIAQKNTVDDKDDTSEKEQGGME